MIKSISKDKENKEEAEMSFFDHLEELRWHLIRAISAIVIIGLVLFGFKSFVFNGIIFAPLQETFPTYQLFQNFIPSFKPPAFELTTVEFGESFFVHIKVSLWLGLIVSFPYVFYEIWRFVKPGLLDKERKAARGTVFVCSALFIAGVLFGYFVITPFGITWLGNYSVGPKAINSPTLSSYVSYLTMFTIPTGLIFELPIVVYFLSRVGLVTPEMMKKYRKHALIVILLLAAIITPPDILTQFLIGIPVFGLYELSILIAKRTKKKYQSEEV
jgi:sec-independent protein translocase protein TatC